MQLQRFQISKYRNIVDSWSIDACEITAFVGQYECDAPLCFLDQPFLH